MAGYHSIWRPWCPDCRRAKQFLGEQRLEYDWIDIDKDAAAAAFVRERNAGKQIIPTIVFSDGTFLVEPSNEELAAKLGLRLRAQRSFYDLLIVGGGPAGLTAAIYAARQGIDSLVIEKSALGGQAGVTERIDNYPGFPDGIGGGELAERIVKQARRYGYVLTPGRYVRAEAQEDDGEPFEDKMKRLVAQLHEQQAEARRLDAAIGANLKELGHGRHSER